MLALFLPISISITGDSLFWRLFCPREGGLVTCPSVHILSCHVVTVGKRINVGERNGGIGPTQIRAE